uniref:FCH domain only protein 2 n=1 Tax=Phallusia mammillata TaxID=59560 RepID=A0A6F9DDJ5_9ASCI|nr:FCH domain only protein 2 [Phallusia mammillata]
MSLKSNSNVPNILAPVVQGAFAQKGNVHASQAKSESLPTTPSHNSLVVPSPAKHGSAHSTPSKDGEKNLGFSVLYHNMKQGQAAVKFLQELLRESASTEDIYAKHLTKLAKQASNVPAVGTFAPMFEIVKVMAEKLSSCHVDVVIKLHDVIKELAKYLDEQKGKHKQVKDELGGTADALSLVQSTTNALKRSKEKYHQQCSEAERLKKSGGLNKDIEKAEAKSKKCGEEYKHLVEKYSNVRSDFEQKMTESAKRFQDVEEAHLKHMKSVLESYILSYENANVLINQVHQEFRRQVNEHSADMLVKQYSEAKGTGPEKPGPIVFEECDLSSVIVDTPVNGSTPDETISAPPNKSSRRPIGLPFRRKKAPSRKAAKDTISAGSKETDRDAESIESPDKDSSVKIDDEGYTIRPETPKSTKDSWGLDSDSDSDSDSDDYAARKIHVKINPKDETVAESAGSDMETLNAITKNLTLNSPTPLGGKRLSPNYNNTTKQKTVPEKSEKSLSDELMDLFGNNTPVANNKTAPLIGSTNTTDTLAGLFASKPESPATSAKNDHLTTSTLPQSSSNVSLNNLFIMPAEKEETSIGSQGNGPMTPVFEPVDTVESTRPTELSLTTPYSRPSKATTPSAPLASSESWSSLSSVGGTTPMDSFASSRGPSPLTLMHGDPIPIAVAFTETVNAYFKGADEQRCMVKIGGEMQMSFPAGIVRAFTSNPNPAVLSFKIKGCPNVHDFTPNPNLLFLDNSQSESSQQSFWFNMSALTSHVKKMADSNPNSPYYNIQILTYQMSSQSGYDMVPLHVSSFWQCESDYTDIRITYKYNNKCTNAPLKNVNVLVPVEGSVTNVQSEPQATWIAGQKRLSWKIPTPITSSTPPGTLHSKLSIASGPSKSSTLAVQFMSEGSTLSGADFELVGTGYRVSLTKRRFVSGKYLSDCT